MMRTLLVVTSAAAIAAGCSSSEPPAPAEPPAWKVLPDNAQEPRLRNLRQITFGGENAEAYWSWDQTKLVYQMRGRRGFTADQIMTMRADGNDERHVSVEGGRTTCAYWLPGDERIIFSSTHLLGREPPKEPERPPHVYAWPLLDYDLFSAKPDGTDLVRLTDTPGYDAEATVAPDGTIVFTSARDGDLEIYTMRPDGSDVRRLTDTPGYDGGPFFSWDGKKIVFRSHHPEPGPELDKFRDYLAKGLVVPSKMDLWIMDADGSNKRKLTNLGKASFGPYLHPNGRFVIFSSNHEDPKGREFEIYTVDVETGAIERVTSSPQFDGFPMFSKDGKTLVFASNRGAEKPGETNLFLAEWVDAR